MSCRRLLTGVVAAVLLVVTGARCLSIASPLNSLAASPQAGASPRTVLTFPFVNASRHPSLDWLSEGFAEVTIEQMARFGPHMVSREQRLAFLERAGIPAATHLSRASMFKIAEQAGANYVIFGQYISDGKTLTISARVFRTNRPALSAEFTQAGTVEQWMPVHARLVGQLLCALDSQQGVPARCGNAANDAEFATKLTSVPQSAFEPYARGLTGSNEEQTLKNMHEAAKIAPAWPAAAQAIGEIYFMRRDCELALPWLSRVPFTSSGGMETAFEAGVCELMRNDPAHAETTFKSLVNPALPAAQTASRDWPGPAARFAEIYSNLGIALAREGKISDARSEFQRATQMRADEPDYWCNLGIAELRAKQPVAAVAAFQRALILEPDDVEARTLHALALEQSGRTEEATSERKILGTTTPSVALPGNAGAADLSRFERIAMRMDLDPVLPAPTTAGISNVAQPPPKLPPTSNANISPRRTERFQLHMDRAAQFLASGDLDDSRRSFLEALLLSPGDAAAHSGLAEVYWHQERPDDAVREFRLALTNRNDASTRTLLARLFVEQNRVSEARVELQQALSVEPNSAEARQLLDELQGKPGAKPSR